MMRTVIRLIGLASLIAAICAILPSSLLPTPSPKVKVTNHRVAVVDGQLLLDGKGWWPIGLNAYQLATNWSINKGCGPETDLDAYFSQLPANSLTRFSALQSFTVNKFTGATDFSTVDAVFAAAQRHQQLLLPVLGDEWGFCEGGPYRDISWYAEDWKHPDSHGLNYLSWVRTAVGRWKDEPALAGWDLMNEPEAGICTTSCEWVDRMCPPNSGQVLRTWFDSIATTVRDIDPTTPISLGLIGTGQCGTAEEDFRRLAESKYLAILQVHDYDPGAIPGDRWNGLAVRLRQAQDVHKPLLAGEMGIRAGSACMSPAERSQGFSEKISAQRSAGIAGTLLWSYIPKQTPGCAYDIFSGDPALGLIAAYRAK